ncbi:vegetative cell wall protein gp1 [Colletotrichum kahawae]|uniref:Vegetative cell wall protein gp1 n=1 Tax=Colletotrichum kahawae TaxID=34407 RepID=A0AAD9YJ59_COLKA|nr:vegetative cell wall protein gp1 [Colletotrichum kahawae]
MEFTLAFGAVGDFIAVLELIRNIVAALDDSRGSTKAYRDVVQSLETLESTLRQIEEVYRDQKLRSFLGELRTIALRNVAQIKRCLEDFNNKIEKFGPSLANSGTKSVLRDAARKVQWRFEEKDLEKLRGELLGHTMSMNTLLELTTLSVVQQRHDATIQQISDSEKRTTANIQDSNHSLMGYLGMIGQRVLSRLESMSQLGMDLSSSTSQIMSVVLAISGEMGRIRTFMMRLERPLSDEHFVFEDAAGRVFPVHLRTITSWEVFEFIITDRFRGKKGSHRIQRGRYKLQERATGREVDRSLDWGSAFLPYQRVDMSMMCRGSHDTTLRGKSPSCPKCMTISPGKTGVEVQW